jgi:cytochrome P450
VQRLREQIESTVETLLEPTEAGASFDAIAQFAYPLPVLVIGALLGVPSADRVHFRSWSAALADGMESTVIPRPDAIARGNGAVEEMSIYLRGLIAERRRQPREDLLSELIAVRDGADRLTEDEMVATALMLFFGGHETTVNLIGNGLLALLRDPAQLSILQSDPALMRGAIDELLRFDSPVQRTFRVAEEPVELGGQHIQPGERVMVLIGAANRDPRRFSAPDVLDVRRADARNHLSLGGGIHYCVGAPLARLETEIALNRLLQRWPSLRLVDERPQWRFNFIFRGLQRLMVEAG